MLDFILLDAAAATGEQAQSGGLGGWGFWIMMILIFVVFYFFMIRPQQKQQKKLQKQRDALRRGDKVVTAGGIYGIIQEVNETTFIVEIAKGITIKVDKASVYVSADEAAQAPKDTKPAATEEKK